MGNILVSVYFDPSRTVNLHTGETVGYVSLGTIPCWKPSGYELHTLHTFARALDAIDPLRVRPKRKSILMPWVCYLVSKP